MIKKSHNLTFTVSFNYIMILIIDWLALIFTAGKAKIIAISALHVPCIKSAFVLCRFVCSNVVKKHLKNWDPNNLKIFEDWCMCIKLKFLKWLELALLLLMSLCN